MDKKRFPITGQWCLECGRPQEIRNQDKPTCVGRRANGKACGSRRFVASLVFVEWWRLMTDDGDNVLRVNRITSE